MSPPDTAKRPNKPWAEITLSHLHRGTHCEEITLGQYHGRRHWAEIITIEVECTGQKSHCVNTMDDTQDEGVSRLTVGAKTKARQTPSTVVPVSQGLSVSAVSLSLSPCCVVVVCLRVYRHHAHMLEHMFAWCQYTRRRFECTHGDILEGEGRPQNIQTRCPHAVSKLF